jgi:hypothetical protein
MAGVVVRGALLRLHDGLVLRENAPDALHDLRGDQLLVQAVVAGMRDVEGRGRHVVVADAVGMDEGLVGELHRFSTSSR